MKKISFLCLLSLIVGSGIRSLLAEEPKPNVEQVEIVIRVDRPYCQDDNTSSEHWDRMLENVSVVATECQGCTSESVAPIVDNMCACIKEIGSVMRTDPSVQGMISITVKDENEQGFQGKVIRR